MEKDAENDRQSLKKTKKWINKHGKKTKTRRDKHGKTDL